MKKIYLATNNQHKFKEITYLLGDKYQVLKRPDGLDETIEDGSDLRANALKKAKEVSEFTNALALSDDSGLFVESLGGAPGVHSARYAGEAADDDANIKKLLLELEKLGEVDRSAHFQTVLCFYDPKSLPVFFEGSLPGKIITEPRGLNGFGYDPVFVPTGINKTLAELSTNEKASMSHRTLALNNFINSF